MPRATCRAVLRPPSVVAVAVTCAQFMHIGRRHAESHQPRRLHRHGWVSRSPLCVRALPLRLSPGHRLPRRARRFLRWLHPQVSQPCLDGGVCLVMECAHPSGGLGCGGGGGGHREQHSSSLGQVGCCKAVAGWRPPSHDAAPRRIAMYNWAPGSRLTCVVALKQQRAPERPDRKALGRVHPGVRGRVRPQGDRGSSQVNWQTARQRGCAECHEGQLLGKQVPVRFLAAGYATTNSRPAPSLTPAALPPSWT